MEYNETLYGKQYLLGTDVYENGKHKILNVPLIDLMDRNGFIPKEDYNQIFTLSVVWYENDGEVMVHQIYDHDSGIIYWEDKSGGFLIIFGFIVVLGLLLLIYFPYF